MKLKSDSNAANESHDTQLLLEKPSCGKNQTQTKHNRALEGQCMLEKDHLNHANPPRSSRLLTATQQRSRAIMKEVESEERSSTMTKQRHYKDETIKVLCFHILNAVLVLVLLLKRAQG